MRKKKVIDERILKIWRHSPEQIRSFIRIIWNKLPARIRNSVTSVIGVMLPIPEPPIPEPPVPEPPVPNNKKRSDTDTSINGETRGFSHTPPPPSPPPKPSFYYPKKRLFDNPAPKISELQKKVLESIFSNLNLFIDKDDKTIFYFPSRLMIYLEKQDAFSAFSHFLKDINLTPEIVFQYEDKRKLLKTFFLGLFDVDICRWGTNLSDQPFYDVLINGSNFYKFNQLLEHLDNCSILYRKIKDDRLSISFYDFKKFQEAIFSEFKYWETIEKENIKLWFNLIEEYQIAYGQFNEYWDSINIELKRLEKIELTDAENQVINSLIQEAEEVNQSLEDGSTDVVNGLSHLKELTDIITGFVDEIFTKRKESKSSSRETKRETKDDLREVYWALKILELTSLETLTLKDLKSARNAQAKRCHPDVGGTNEDMINVSNAYDMLKNYLDKK